jgi:hypothetical protein
MSAIRFGLSYHHLYTSEKNLRLESTDEGLSISRLRKGQKRAIGLSYPNPDIPGDTAGIIRQELDYEKMRKGKNGDYFAIGRFPNTTDPNSWAYRIVFDRLGNKPGSFAWNNTIPAASRWRLADDVLKQTTYLHPKKKKTKRSKPAK